MKFTNSFGLPQGLVNALTGNDYDLRDKPRNILSVTEILSPPKIKELEYRHRDEIEVDVSERLWLLLGNACHNITERAAGDEHLVEERWYLDLDADKLTTVGEDEVFWETSVYDSTHTYISGKLDIYDHATGKLSDYKITSIWSWLIEKAMKFEHEAQLNFNAYALRKMGFQTLEISILMLFRDWSKTKSKIDYPELPIPMKEVEGCVWSDNEVMAEIKARVELHLAARELSDEAIPVCAPEERWARSGKWAVMKVGGKKAVKLYDERPSEETMKTVHPGCYLDERPGEDIRCKDYCPAARYCEYYRDRYGVDTEGM